MAKKPMNVKLVTEYWEKIIGQAFKPAWDEGSMRVAIIVLALILLVTFFGGVFLMFGIVSTGFFADRVREAQTGLGASCLSIAVFAVLFILGIYSVPAKIYYEHENTINNLKPGQKRIIVTPFNDPIMSLVEKIGIVIHNPNAASLSNISIELKQIDRLITNGEWNTVISKIKQQPAEDNCHFKKWANAIEPTINGNDKEVMYLGGLADNQLIISLEKKDEHFSQDQYWVTKISNDVALSYFDLDFFIKWTIDEKRFSEHCLARIDYTGTRIYSNSIKKIDETIVTQIFMREVKVLEN